MQILEINPEPLIISDTTSHFLSIFGGIIPLASTQQLISNSSAILDLQKDIVDLTDVLTPLLDDAYRIEMSSYNTKDKLATDIAPFRKKIRFASGTSDWRLDKQLVRTFQHLRNLILEQFLDGRHTAFGLTPNSKQLFFAHMLQKDSRKIHEFIGTLQLKILELFSLQGKLHYFSQQNNLNITILLDNFNQDSLIQDENRFIYY